MNPIFMNMLLWGTHITRQDHAPVIKELKEMTFDGVEIPVLEGDESEYAELGGFLTDEGMRVSAVGMAGDPTNDHTSSHETTRARGIDGVKKQVDRARALGAKSLGGPYQLIWGWRPNAPANPSTFFQIVGEKLKRSEESLQTVTEYAATAGVTLFIEYLTRWEIVGINTMSQALTFVRSINHPFVGILADSAHEVLDGEGPDVFADCVKEAMEDKIPLHVHLSAPHRRETTTSWLPWEAFLQPFVQNHYGGPYVIEIFDAKSPFFEGVRIATPPFALPLEAVKSALRNTRHALAATQKTLTTDIH